MFVIIGIWGGERRVYAAFKFFLYTFFGSLPWLIAIVYLYLRRAFQYFHMVYGTAGAECPDMAVYAC